MDELIEKKEEIIKRLNVCGDRIFSSLNDDESLPTLNYVEFIKGKEVGSKNYLDKVTAESVPYIRVSNLESRNYGVFVQENQSSPKCKNEDVLLALDGAPGRIGIAHNGYYSSGIYKVKTLKQYLGAVYFYLRSPACQEVIKTNSQGTTIMHAEKSINEMKIPSKAFDKSEIFNAIYSDLIFQYLKIYKLKQIKELLLKKYFD